MKYTVISSAQFTYPDIWDYETSSSEINVFSARGGYASFQILLDGKPQDDLTVSFGELPSFISAEVYSLIPIQVEDNYGIEPEQFSAHFPERVAPYYIFDCARPFNGEADFSKGFGGLYIALKTERDAVAGEYSSFVAIGNISIPLNLKVYPAVLPEETLKIIVGYDSETCAKYHNVEMFSKEHIAIEEKYLAMLRRMHQNMMYTSGIKAAKTGENQWDFDFTEFIETVKRYEKAGMTFFNAPAIGARKSWSEPTIVINDEIEAMSFEGFCYLRQFLSKLVAVLKQNGWLERFYLGIADEPNPANCTEFRALCGLVRKIAPELRLLDALEYTDVHGALDVWIPKNSEYERHQKEFEAMREAGDELWHYVCNNPREKGYINRFMDYPLLATRYLHWGNYKYDLKGFLHWASNGYQPEQDPFIQSCPGHRNTDAEFVLPPGDTHIIYPGDGEPWMSLRLEAEREGAEEYELLCELAKTDKAKADAICDALFRSFKDVEYDVLKFIEIKKQLLEALS